MLRVNFRPLCGYEVNHALIAVGYGWKSDVFEGIRILILLKYNQICANLTIFALILLNSNQICRNLIKFAEILSILTTKSLLEDTTASPAPTILDALLRIFTLCIQIPESLREISMHTLEQTGKHGKL